MFGRTLCSIFSDMRSCSKTKNFSYLDGLIEEAQAGANSLESALWDKKKLEYVKDNFKEFKKAYKKVKKNNPKVDFSDLDKAVRGLDY